MKESNAEVDRLLAAQQARLDSVTTRSAALTGAAALSGSVLVARLSDGRGLDPATLLVFGLAILAGVVVLLGARLQVGPLPDKIIEWQTLYPGQLVDLVVTTKVIAVFSNEHKVRRTDQFFYLQAVLVAGAAVLAVAGF